MEMNGVMAPVLGEATVQELRESVRGEIFEPGDEGYEEASRIWNGMFDDRRPALIVRCTGAADVIAAVGFARSQDLDISVRGGAHSTAGFSTNNDGIVIDLSPMRSVRVDPAARRATVGGGAVWSDVDHETQAHGLATTGGLISSTGVAGFTLGGGVGWLMRRYGLALDNLVGTDVVTADGALVHASATENPELFWGLRGGGGNFGIVTQFEFQLYPVGPIVYAGPIFFSADDDVALIRTFREWSAETPDEVTGFISLTSAPPLPVIPEEWHGKKVAVFVATFAGAVEEAEPYFRKIRAVAEPVADLLGPMPYRMMQSLLDPLWPKGIQAYFKGSNLAKLDDGLIEAWAKLHVTSPGPQCEIHIHQMGGAIARVAESDTAFGDRSMPFLLNCVTGWYDPRQSEAHIDWARSVVAAAESDSTGRVYVNFAGDGGARGAYTEGTYERLAALKATYDPTNVFHFNKNIEPAA
jgi:FAD/FMN-containing dehydrogenase